MLTLALRCFQEVIVSQFELLYYTFGDLKSKTTSSGDIDLLKQF